MRLLAFDEVAERLSISPRTLHRLKDSGKLPAPVRLNRCLRWSEHELEQWIADGCPDCRRRNRKR